MMSNTLIEVKNLTTEFGRGEHVMRVVDNVSFSINESETFVLLGESGSGKSIIAMSIMRLLPLAARVSSGKILFNGRDLFKLSERDMRDIRGANIGIIFQEPQTSLNPVLTAGQQIRETLSQHKGLSKKQSMQRSIELLDAVGIPEPQRRVNEYPHQFSGGMKQRIMIAIALAGEPELLVADEPTTALDVTIQAQVLELLKQLQRDIGMAILFITHDLGVAAQMADHVAVMKQGAIVEIKGGQDGLLAKPEHPYTLQLFDAIPSRKKRVAENGMIETDKIDHECLLSVSNLKVYYPIRKGLFKRVVGHVKAVDDVSIDVHEGETVALVGESGSGKTTMGKGVLQLLQTTAGTVMLNGKNLCNLGARELRDRRSDIQIVFQDPYSSMNPRMMVRDILQEGMLAQGVGGTCEARDKLTAEILGYVGLLPEHQYRYPHEFSGGQRQRICIARALALKPKLIICDEPTSALDVSVQAQILELLKQLQREHKISYLFITHNISVVEYIAHYVAVMHSGKIVEQGKVDQVLQNPQNEYTKRLLAAVPRIEW